MNRILGFFRQKISQAKQQNKQQLQAIANALNQNEYSTDRVLTLLQSIKANYMNWNILIANQASTGLYYSQLHNRNICLRKIKGNDELRKQLDRNALKLSHIKQTAGDLKQINSLNENWMASANNDLQGINKYLTAIKNKYKKEEQQTAKVQKEQIVQPQKIPNLQPEIKEIEQNIQSAKQANQQQQKQIIQEIAEDDT